MPELRHLPGFMSADLGQRQLDGKLEFLVLTRWQSMDAIRAFAGEDVENAVVEPGAVAALIEYDTSVRHYEIIEDVQPR
jgi:heme-degrading monooxygenase HmoA